MSKPSFVYVTYIRSTPEKVWEALTTREFTQKYWFGASLRSGCVRRFSLMTCWVVLAATNL